MKISSITMDRIKSSIKYLFVLPFNLLPIPHNIWLISERQNQARDNGYVLFKYIREKYPKEKVYYLIDKSSKDYKKIERYGNIIQFDSWKHYYYYCLSKVHISAHVNGCCPNFAAGVSKRTKKMLGFEDVFIPHGVSYGISEFCLQKYAKINLFICSGKPEYENVLKNYGYCENEVAYTGFPRLDEWYDIHVNKKQILLMPTWRLYLAQNESTNFIETKYFQMYQSLLEEERLNKFLETNDLRMIFYLHNDMRKYVEFFSTNCKNIVIVDNDDMYDIQELLKESALLITDYSSVHFDFAYMNKPVLYYQFDQKEFFSKQYQNSGFNAETDGFGPVSKNCNDLISYLKQSYRDEFKLKDKYYLRMRNFYQIYDKGNCERVYKTIKERIE